MEWIKRKRFPWRDKESAIIISYSSISEHIIPLMLWITEEIKIIKSHWVAKRRVCVSLRFLMSFIGWYLNGIFVMENVALWIFPGWICKKETSRQKNIELILLHNMFSTAETTCHWLLINLFMFATVWPQTFAIFRFTNH